MMSLGKETHPIADLFPMLPDDELRELAADIKERGLLYPVVLDLEGRILDGRNRFAACQLAGVDPQFVTYEGDDPAGYTLSVNINRRHLSKGQQAILVAKVGELSNLDNQSQFARENGLSRQRLSQAQLIQAHAPELVDSVINGHVSLDAAYQTARDRKAADEALAKDIEDLKRHFADLEEKVRAEEISLAEALTIAAMRQQDAREQEEVHKQHVRISSKLLAQSIHYLVEMLGHPAAREALREIFDNDQSGENFTVTKATIRTAVNHLSDLEEVW